MPEKGLNDISPDLRKLFRKGMDALQRENYDYAIALFNQILAQEPACYECRESLRKAQQEKAAGKGGGFFKKAFNFAGSQPTVTKAQLTVRNNPLEAIHTVEQVLNNDPLNVGAHRVVAEAALAAGMPRTAVLSFEIVHKHNPRDKEAAIQFAHALADSGDIPRAEQILAELTRANPHDSEISQALKNVSARRTMDEGGYDALADGTGSYRDILRNKEEATMLEQEQRVEKAEDVSERLINEYEARLRNEPDNLKLLRSLAELYTQKKNFERALHFYEKVKASPDAGNDPGLDRAIADTVTRRFAHQIEQLDPTSPDYAEKTAQLQQEKLSYQLAECQKRVEKFPTDLAIRFELGQLYFQAGKMGEAIQEFQKAQSNPHKRIQAMSYLAQSFAKRNMDDLAARTLQNALKEKAVFDDEKKDLIYNLGCVLDKMGKREEAIEQFKLIYEVDIGYRDVAAKVDAYYASS